MRVRTTRAPRLGHVDEGWARARGTTAPSPRRRRLHRKRTPAGRNSVSVVGHDGDERAVADEVGQRGGHRVEQAPVVGRRLGERAHRLRQSLRPPIVPLVLRRHRARPRPGCHGSSRVRRDELVRASLRSASTRASSSPTMGAATGSPTQNHRPRPRPREARVLRPGPRRRPRARWGRRARPRRRRA